MIAWLYRQLSSQFCVLLVGSVLLSSTSLARAQDPFGDEDRAPHTPVHTMEGAKKPRTKLTRDQAAKEFASFLNDISQLDESSSQFQKISDSISLKSKRELDYRFRSLFRVMSSQWKQSDQTVRLQSEGDKTATVTVESLPAPRLHPLILVEEGGGWGVDLVETYSQWNGLNGAAKAEAIYNLTGVVLKGITRTEHIVRSSCQSNLKFIAFALANYVGGPREKYPLARNWMDAVKPYLQNETLLTCPALSQQHYGYAYNSNLSNKSFDVLANPRSTVTVYETSVLKRNAYGTGENPAFRHAGGANYIFADGHVKWFPKGQAPSFKLKP